MEVRAMNIRTLREQCGMTQEDLAKRLGVKNPAVSKWERGMAYPSMNTAIEMAGLFQVSLDVVLGLAPIPRNEETA